MNCRELTRVDLERDYILVCDAIKNWIHPDYTGDSQSQDNWVVVVNDGTLRLPSTKRTLNSFFGEFKIYAPKNPHTLNYKLIIPTKGLDSCSWHVRIGCYWELKIGMPPANNLVRSRTPVKYYE